MSSNRTPQRGDQSRLLVTGATGMQGGAVVRAALRAGFEVTAFVRDPLAPAAKALNEAGVRLAVGQLEDVASLDAACAGQNAVFSVQPAPARRNADSERIQGTNLARAASRAGVDHLVHTSVSGTGWRQLHPEVDPGPLANYWSSKEDVEAAVRAAGTTYTIVKPAFFLDNLVPPKAIHMFPLMPEGELLVACDADTKVAFIGSEDFADVVVQVLQNRERFGGTEIELASDTGTYPEIADAISRATGRTLVASCRSEAEVNARLGAASWSPTQVWLNQVGYPARPSHAASFGLTLDTSISQWASKHRDSLMDALSA